jgi:hypothetical protein
MRDEAIAAIKWLVHFVPVGKWRFDGTPITRQWEMKRDVYFRIEEAWTFAPTNSEEKPVAFLEELYRQRVIYKRAEHYDVREKCYKLPANSFYGKIMQRVGGVETLQGF